MNLLALDILFMRQDAHVFVGTNSTGESFLRGCEIASLSLWEKALNEEDIMGLAMGAIQLTPILKMIRSSSHTLRALMKVVASTTLQIGHAGSQEWIFGRTYLKQRLCCLQCAQIFPHSSWPKLWQ